MPDRGISERRHLPRVAMKKRASLIIDNGRQPERVPCLILDSSHDGFRIGGASRLKRGQPVELISDERASSTVACRVVWVGKPGSKQDREVGLEVIHP